MPRSRLRRRHPLLAAAACSAIVLLTALCAVLTTRLSRCNADQSFSFSKLSAGRMEQQQQQQQRHGSTDRKQRLAVLVPYRDRPRQLAEMLQITARCLARGGADASIFVLEQAPGLHFNRGALLNAGALLLAGSGYDCFVFHDVDTVCGSHEAVSEPIPVICHIASSRRCTLTGIWLLVSVPAGTALHPARSGSST
jgi:N-terminal region of glycosyl transferase group 7